MLLYAARFYTALLHNHHFLVYTHIHIDIPLILDSISSCLSFFLDETKNKNSMTKSLDGKVAVLTGASRNIGKAVAVELVRLGAKVVIGDVLDAQGEETVRELNDA